MNFYETKHQYITKSGEVRIYKYNVQYQAKPKKYDSIKETYKDIINDNSIPRNEKINKIYNSEKDNYTIEQIRNLIYRVCKGETTQTTKHKSYKPLQQKYNDIINNTEIKRADKVRQIYDLENKDYSLNSIKKFVYYYSPKIDK